MFALLAQLAARQQWKPLLALTRQTDNAEIAHHVLMELGNRLLAKALWTHCAHPAMFVPQTVSRLLHALALPTPSVKLAKPALMANLK